MHKCFHHVADPAARGDANKSDILRTILIILIIIGCIPSFVITDHIGKLIMGLCIAVTICLF